MFVLKLDSNSGGKMSGVTRHVDVQGAPCSGGIGNASPAPLSSGDQLLVTPPMACEDGVRLGGVCIRGSVDAAFWIPAEN